MTMPPSHIPLTLIVATTPSLGIGLKGNLPWPPLKSDLAFFARVTKRILPTSEPSATRHNIKNAVIMGRKTWESIPPKFRPLKDRINVVITRSPDRMRAALEIQRGDVFAAVSLEEALKELADRYPPHGFTEKSSDINTTASSEASSTTRLGRSFVIGGAEIYTLALKAPSCQRVLWTRLNSDFDCDTFFAHGVLHLPNETSRDGAQDTSEWAVARSDSLRAWTGEPDAGEVSKDGDIEFQVVMLEKSNAGSHG